MPYLSIQFLTYKLAQQIFFFRAEIYIRIEKAELNGIFRSLEPGDNEQADALSDARRHAGLLISNASLVTGGRRKLENETSGAIWKRPMSRWIQWADDDKPLPTHMRQTFTDQYHFVDTIMTSRSPNLRVSIHPLEVVQQAPGNESLDPDVRIQRVENALQAAVVNPDPGVVFQPWRGPNSALSNVEVQIAIPLLYLSQHVVQVIWCLLWR